MNQFKKNYPVCPVSKQFQITSIISAFEYTYGKNYCYEGESHDFWELDLILDGSASIAVDSEIYELQSNQIIFLKPLQFHNLRSIKNTSPHVCILSFGVTPGLDLDRQIYTVSESTRTELIQTLKMAKDLFYFDKNIFVTSVRENKTLELQLFINMLENIILSIIMQKSPTALPVKTRTAINYALIVNILKNNIHRSLTIHEIAGLANMSPGNLKKTFSIYANQGVISYFHKLKLIEGKQLLRSGLSVKEVSQKLGFSEQSYFSAVFKKSTGLSPTKWLKACGEAKTAVNSFHM